MTKAEKLAMRGLSDRMAALAKQTRAASFNEEDVKLYPIIVELNSLASDAQEMQDECGKQ